MENFLYTCLNCGKQFKPTRRLIQKYCSNSCRTNAFNKRKIILGKPNSTKKHEPIKIEQISWSGVGNAAIGTAAIKIVEHFFIPEDVKPATKGDIKNLESRLRQTYFLIKNIPNNSKGQKPYFDLQKGIVVYK